MQHFNPDGDPDELESDEIGDTIEEIERENMIRQIVDHRQDPEEENPVEKGEVPQEKFLEILTSAKFLDALRLAGEVTGKTGHETSFRIDLFKKGEFFVSDIEEGLTYEISHEGTPPRVIKEAELDETEHIDRQCEEKMSNFIDFHFHPDDQGPICPSFVDLTNGISVYEVGGIGQITKKGVIKILLIKKTGKLVSADLEEDLFDLADDITQRKVHDVLKENGYASTIISFHKKDGGYELSQASKSVLEKFAPIPVTFQ